jgi:hypothetical protein
VDLENHVLTVPVHYLPIILSPLVLYTPLPFFPAVSGDLLWKMECAFHKHQENVLAPLCVFPPLVKLMLMVLPIGTTLLAPWIVVFSPNPNALVVSKIVLLEMDFVSRREVVVLGPVLLILA